MLLAPLICWLKTRLARWTTVIEFCHDCGVRQPLVWWADNSLWSEVTGAKPVDGDNMPGILCPNCFDRRADKMGLLLFWRPEIENRRATREAGETDGE